MMGGPHRGREAAVRKLQFFSKNSKGAQRDTANVPLDPLDNTVCKNCIPCLRESDITYGVQHHAAFCPPFREEKTDRFVYLVSI